MTDQTQYPPPLVAPDSPRPTLRGWWLTAGLIGINLLVFVFASLSGVDPLSPDNLSLLTLGANFAPLTATGEPWRLLSSMFIHIGVLHLVINLWALYIFGSYAEFYFGRRFYAVLYLLSGLMGSIATTWWNLAAAEAMLGSVAPTQLPAISAGASGAIMGLGGALLIAAWRPRADLPVSARLNLRMLITLMLINLAIGIVIPNIDNAVHLGGAVAGGLLAWLFTFSHQTRPAQQSVYIAIRWAGVLLFTATLYYLKQQIELRGVALEPLGQQIRLELNQPRLSGE